MLQRAAEEVFVDGGYAGAELGEIASIAGRTKGAIYAQFESKEDIFMALVEDHALRYRSEMEKVRREHLLGTWTFRQSEKQISILATEIH